MQVVVCKLVLYEKPLSRTHTVAEYLRRRSITAAQLGSVLGVTHTIRAAQHAVGCLKLHLVEIIPRRYQDDTKNDNIIKASPCPLGAGAILQIGGEMSCKAARD